MRDLMIAVSTFFSTFGVYIFIGSIIFYFISSSVINYIELKKYLRKESSLDASKKENSNPKII